MTIGSGTGAPMRASPSTWRPARGRAGTPRATRSPESRGSAGRTTLTTSSATTGTTASMAVRVRTPLDGGDGNDFAGYWGSDAGVTVNLATGTGQGGHAEGDMLTGIEKIMGIPNTPTTSSATPKTTASGAERATTHWTKQVRVTTIWTAARARMYSMAARASITAYRHSDAGVIINLATGTGAGRRTPRATRSRGSRGSTGRTTTPTTSPATTGTSISVAAAATTPWKAARATTGCSGQDGRRSAHGRRGCRHVRLRGRRYGCGLPGRQRPDRHQRLWSHQRRQFRDERHDSAERRRRGSPDWGCRADVDRGQRCRCDRGRLHLGVVVGGSLSTLEAPDGLATPGGGRREDEGSGVQ